MINNDGLIYKFFRNKKISLYKLSDYIEFMPQGNVDFVLNHNNLIEKESVEKLLNTITPLDTQSLSTKQLNEIRRK